MKVADEILFQLGGDKFIAMTGAKMFVGDENGLMFALPAKFAADGINKVRITLTTEDLYDVEFFKIRGLNVKTVAKYEAVYADSLCDVFAARTGLLTRL